MNENRKRGTSNNKILTAIAIASLFIGSSKIMAIETYSENSFGVTEQMQAQTARGIVVDQNGEPIIGASILEKGTTNGVTTDLYGINPEKPDVPLNKNDAFQKVQKRRVQEKR